MIGVGSWGTIGQGPTKLVLEAGPADHDLATALRYVDAAARVGAWAVKFQMYQPARLVTRDAPRYDNTGGGGPTQWSAFADAMPYEQWGHVYRYATDVGQPCFFSVFDFEAVDRCAEWDVPAYKIASADITYKQLIRRVAEVGRPILMSTGAAETGEVEEAVRWVAEVDPTVPVLLMVCTLCYPAPLEEAHLGRISMWAKGAGRLVGYSDHTAEWTTPLLAAEQGACLVEKHFTLSRGAGFDHDFAVNEDEAGLLVDVLGGVTDIGFDDGHVAAAVGRSTVGVLEVEGDARRWARRSVAAAVDIPKGSVLGADMLTCLRPGTGIRPADLEGYVLGRTYGDDLVAGELLDARRLDNGGRRRVGAVV